MNFKKMLTFGLLGSSMAQGMPSSKNKCISDLAQDSIKQNAEASNKSLMRSPPGLEQEYTDALISGDAINLYHAQSPQNALDQLLGKVQKQIIKIKDLDLSKGRLLYTTPLIKALNDMVTITKGLETDAYDDRAPRHSRERLEKLANLLDDVTIIYTEAEKVLSTMQINDKRSNETKENFDTIKKYSKYVEEVIAGYRGCKFTPRDYSDISYYPNFKKRFNELTPKLEKISKSVHDIELSLCSLRDIESNNDRKCKIINPPIIMESDELEVLEKQIKEVQIEIKSVQKEMKEEQFSLQFLLERNQIKTQLIDSALFYTTTKYDEQLHLAMEYDTRLFMSNLRIKDGLANKKNLSEQLAAISTKVQKNKNDKTLIVKQDSLVR